MLAPDPAQRTDGSARGWRAAGEPAALLALVFLAALFCLSLPHGALKIAPIWLPSAIVLSALLRAEERRWPWLIAAGVAGHALASLSLGFAPERVTIRVAASALEYAGAAVLVRRYAGRNLDMESPRDFIRLCTASVACALVAGVLQALALWGIRGEEPITNLRAWYLSHPLCLLVVTPCLLVLGRPRLHLGMRGLTPRAGWALAGMLVTALMVFGQSRFPVLFMVLPVIVAVSLEAGLYGAAMAVLIIASVALPTTMSGVGPVALSHGDVSEKAAVLQLFLAVSLFSSLPVAALQARWRRAETLAREEAARALHAEALATASEARLRMMTDKASDALGTMDMTGRLTFISPAIEGITGHSAEELTDRDLAPLIHPDDYPAVIANFRQLLRSRGESGEPIEYRFRRKDGEWVWLQANPRLVRDGAGAAIGTVDVVRDVSARKAMELELAAALEAARAGARAKSEFLANMSHELRTPLTGVLGYAEVLARDPALPEPSRRHAERIGAAGSMLLTLVNDVLDLSRAEAGGLTLHPGRTDLAQLVQNSVDMIRPQAQRGSLALCIEPGGHLPAVTVDADRLQQVLVNLLGNAVKFTRRGVVSASLRGEPARGGLDVRLSVADTGMGIPADRLPHIFDRFEQADGSISRSFGGAGLGLAISRTLVRAMGGELTVESTVGAGSVFTARLHLPLADSAAPSTAEPTASPTDEAKTLTGLRVLLAEDVAVNRDLIALMLSPLDVSLQAVADGAAAVEAAAVEAFDVVLMDMQMPVMDGLEATRRIRAGAGPSAAARIVALTANVLPEEVERCLAAGMDDHLSKPLASAALVAQLRAGRTPGRLSQAA